jgi:cytochrome c biogenesis protein CcdA/thiol-disulfide isomerase/thioredoxin
MTLLIISFIAGVLTVLAPCILPLLPVIIGGSLTHGQVNKKRVLTVTLALGLSVILFTFVLKVSSLFINVPEDFWSYLSGAIIIILGIIMIFPNLWEKISFNALINRKSNEVLSQGYKKNSFWGDVVVGAALGPIFSTCSPTYFIVLATVLPVKPILGLAYLLAYVVGLCLMLFLIAILGQKIMKKLNIAADPKGWLKRSIGFLFLLVGIFIITGFNKSLQTSIINSGVFDITKVEQNLLQKSDAVDDGLSSDVTDVSNTEDTVMTTDGMDNITETNTTDTKVKAIATATNVVTTKSGYLTIAEKNKKYPVAPELSSPDGFINTDGKPVTIASLKGKVVLLDIWTYSCINCQRTIPYLNTWYDEYEKDGLVIIGLHTPEFAFEKVQANVEKATKEFGIKYPVVLDNDYSTWNAYGNRYWPRKYLIDIDGFIVYDHIGEGDYDVTEKAIQKALMERASRLGLNEDVNSTTSAPKDSIEVNMGMIKSPEAYFGSLRNEYLANGDKGTTGEQTLVIPSIISRNKIYMSGTWNFTPEYTEGVGEILFDYDAKNVYLVLSSDNGAEIEIKKDGVVEKTIEVKDEKLYTLIDGSDYGQHRIQVAVKNGKLKIFAFTFG